MTGSFVFHLFISHRLTTAPSCLHFGVAACRYLQAFPTSVTALNLKACNQYKVCSLPALCVLACQQNASSRMNESTPKFSNAQNGKWESLFWFPFGFWRQELLFSLIPYAFDCSKGDPYLCRYVLVVTPCVLFARHWLIYNDNYEGREGVCTGVKFEMYPEEGFRKGICQVIFFKW